MCIIVRYQHEFRTQWNQFVKDSKNGTFLLEREFMEYHSDRFTDYSLLFFEGMSLIAVLPASIHGNELRSHGGLTYGGLIIGRKMTVQKTVNLFDELKAYLKSNGIGCLIYKRVPSIYHTYPSDEDLYALFRVNAVLIRRDISTAIFLPDRIRFNERRRRNIKKAVKAGLLFKKTLDFSTYINMLTKVLQSQHGVKPVHTADEMKRLADLFPDNIKLFAAYHGDNMIAGSLIFETATVAHAQYIANSQEGKSCGALDFVFDKLINEIYVDKQYFDFGISTEKSGLYLNEGLVEQKQEFGGRGIVYDFYRIEL